MFIYPLLRDLAIMDSDTSTSASSESSSEFSSISYNSDLSVFIDESRIHPRKISPEKLRFTAQQLAEFSVSQHYPKFTNPTSNKCAMLHWACHVGWCLCKYQYQPLTPLHLLPNTPISTHQVIVDSRERLESFKTHQIEYRPRSNDSSLNFKEEKQKTFSNMQNSSNDTVVYELETTV